MNMNCLICYEPLTVHRSCNATKCGHVFHSICLAAWIQYNRTCPTCRAAVNRNQLTRIYFTEAAAPGEVSGGAGVEPAGEREAVLGAEVTKLKSELQQAQDTIHNLVNCVSRTSAVGMRPMRTNPRHRRQRIMFRFPLSQQLRRYRNTYRMRILSAGNTDEDLIDSSNDEDQDLDQELDVSDSGEM